jgi:ribosomal-protein-alanine N-acetyltransferase
VRRIKGERVELRRFRVSDEPAVWAARQAADPSASPSGPGRRSKLHKRLLASGAFHRGSLDLAIETAGALVGDVQARQGIGQRLPPGVVELGIQLYDPTQRGKGYGTETIALITTWLFENNVAERVQASTEKGNRAMRRVLERLGFTFEGVLRGFMPVGDHRDDFAIYGVIKQEWLQRSPSPESRKRRAGGVSRRR